MWQAAGKGAWAIQTAQPSSKSVEGSLCRLWQAARMSLAIASGWTRRQEPISSNLSMSIVKGQSLRRQPATGNSETFAAAECHAWLTS